MTHDEALSILHALRVVPRDSPLLVGWIQPSFPMDIYVESEAVELARMLQDARRAGRSALAVDMRGRLQLWESPRNNDFWNP